MLCILRCVVCVFGGEGVRLTHGISSSLFTPPISNVCPSLGYEVGEMEVWLFSVVFE